MKESRSDGKKVGAVSKALKSKSLAGGESLHQAIAMLAYQRAESRGFEPGHEMEDWLHAENEVLAEREGLKGFPA